MSTIRCTNCGAPVEHDGNRDHIFCTYCGSQIDLTSGNTSHREHYIQEYRNVDAARIKEADRDVEIKKLEYEIEALRLQAQNKAEPHRIKALVVWIGFIIAMLLLMALGEKIDSEVFTSGGATILLVALAATPFVLWLTFRKRR